MGLSHLGVISSIIAAIKNFQVVGYDPEANIPGELSRGHLSLLEPGLANAFAKTRHNLKFTNTPSDLSQCNVVFISYDIPTNNGGESDLSLIHSLLNKVQDHLADNCTLVILSQVPPGFTREVATSLRIKVRNHPIHVFYQAETLVFGNAVNRALNPERHIVGCMDTQAKLPQAYMEFLESWDCPTLVMSYESAELAKIAINSYLASSVCVTNTLAELCESLGADWSEIRPVLQLDKRIGPHAYLQPGLGLTGGHLSRDLATLKALSMEQGTEAGIVDAWILNSQHRLKWVARAIKAEYPKLQQSLVVAIWGLAYKPNTNSTKDSATLALIDQMPEHHFQIYDPEAQTESLGYENCTQADSALSACKGADVLAIMTAWDQFRPIETQDIQKTMRGEVVIDPYALLDEASCEAQGLRYHTLGTPVKAAK